MLISIGNLDGWRPDSERDTHDGAASVKTSHPNGPRFASILEQASPAPFAPWPLTAPDIKTPATHPPTQITQPAERGRRQDQRRGRG